MPDIGLFHPQIVHFVVALLFVGVGARLLAFLPLGERFRFLSPAAAVLVILGTVAAVGAVESGTDAHDAVERIPGVRPAVIEHEEWGERARNAFFFVAAFEIAGLALGGPRLRRGFQIAAAVGGIAGCLVLFEAAEHGGDLVYRYAGGVGIRSGDTTDVRRLLTAGLYYEAMRDRRERRPDDAARLIDEMARRSPDDLDIRIMRIDSRLRDRRDPKGALAALDSVPVPADNARLASRLGGLRVDAFLALGWRDSAVAVMDGLLRLQPNNSRLRARRDSLQRAP